MRVPPGWTDDGDGTFVLVRNGVKVAWVEPEIQRLRHDPTTDRRTGRWFYGDYASKGVRSTRALAVKAAEALVEP